MYDDGMMDMGSMDMEDGMPTLSSMQTTYWAFVGAAIAFATLVNVLNKFTCWERTRATGKQDPAKPKRIIPRAIATTTAICREIAYARPPSAWLPSLGRTLLVASQTVLVLVLCFYKMDVQDQWSWEDLGYRTGYVTAAQLPLIYILSGKNNIIGLLTGFGYEKLNWLHRWTARVLLLSATIHLIFWFESWARWKYIAIQLRKDPITQRGFAAWCILVWIVLSSSAPFRRMSYEVFVVQHVVSLAGFSAAIYLHLPIDLKMLVWISVAFAIFDRALRTSIVLYNNLSIFHPRSKGPVWASKASLKPLSEGFTRVSIRNPSISWKPGQHVFLSCHSVVPLQSHPFTISSLPSDEVMQFIVQTRSGGSKRLSKQASKGLQLPVSESSTALRYNVAIEGPYGRIRPLRQFDSLVFFAGGVGSTFTVPLMRDLVHSWRRASDPDKTPARVWQSVASVTRFIRFIWVVKSRDQVAWFRSELSQAAENVASLRVQGHDVELKISVYLTCDELLQVKQTPLRDCKPELQQEKFSAQDQQDSGSDETCGIGGTCCCQTTIQDDGGDVVARCTCAQSSPRISSGAQGGDNSGSSSDDEAAGTKSSTTSFTETKESLHPSIVVQTGRPHPRTVIRSTLEQADGESAVVVCGPTGLVNDVQTSVVALSDERAVHKGTGAQGIYLHVEQFCF